MSALIALGRCRLEVIGLNPQSIVSGWESRLPDQATFTGMDYQKTGIGERTTLISALTYPHILGGMDDLAWLKRHHERQEQISYIRLGSQFLGQIIGLVIIRRLDHDETHLHPLSRVGRSIAVDVELVHVD